MQKCETPQPDRYVEETSVLNFMAEAVHGEHSIIDTRSKVILIGCKAKGISASHRQCITQLLALPGSSAMALRKHGLALKDCASLGIAFHTLVFSFALCT